MREQMFVERDGRHWFDLTAFADLLGQPWVADREANVRSFTEIPARREGMMVDARTPGRPTSRSRTAGARWCAWPSSGAGRH